MRPERYLPDDLLPRYRVTVTPLPGGNYYWHLWRGSERVNGGISDGETDAFEDGYFAAIRYDLLPIQIMCA
jgi:hypothetical protein